MPNTAPTSTAQVANGNNAVAEVRSDLQLLVRYALELKLDSDEIGDALVLVNKPETDLTEQDVEQMAKLSAKILPAESPVTIDSLRATGRGLSSGPTITGRHIRWLWCWVASLVGLIVLHTLGAIALDMQGTESAKPLTGATYLLFALVTSLDVLVPFTYGSIGACVYLMRITGEHLRHRTFDPKRIPEHRNRLVLGTLCGGVITLFVEQVGEFELSAAALGFLAGYSVEFLFQAIDRVVAAILPAVGTESVKKSINAKRQQLVLKRYRARLSQSTDPDEKKLLEEVISDLSH